MHSGAEKRGGVRGGLVYLDDAERCEVTLAGPTQEMHSCVLELLTLPTTWTPRHSRISL